MFRVVRSVAACRAGARRMSTEAFPTQESSARSWLTRASAALGAGTGTVAVLFAYNNSSRGYALEEELFKVKRSADSRAHDREGRRIRARRDERGRALVAAQKEKAAAELRAARWQKGWIVSVGVLGYIAGSVLSR
jgi:hypothetical protein